MSVEQRASAADRVLAARERYVARGVATPALVVARAWGARHLGRRRPRVPRLRRRHRLPEPRPRQRGRRRPRSTSRSTATSTSASWSATYEPYVDLCRAARRALAGQAPRRSRSSLNSGAEAIENAVKIARAATGRAGRRRLRPRVPRAHEPDDGDDVEARLQAGLRAARHGRLPRARAVPVPRRLDGGRAARPRAPLQAGRRPASRSRASCSSRCRARAASSRCRRSSCRRCASSATSTGSSTSTTRCRPAAGAPARCGRSSSYGVEPDLLVSGKTLGGGLPLAAVTGRAELMDAVARRRARRHVRRQPGRLRGRARRARRAGGTGLPRAGRADRTLLRTRLEEIAARQPLVGEVRGLGAMLALELREQNARRREGDDRGRVREGAASSSRAASTGT